MDIKSIVNVIEDVAPLLAGALTGPAGIAVSAVGMLAKTFSADPTSHVDIINKITADPDKDQKLKTIESDLAKTTLQESSVNDVDDARERQIKLASLGDIDKTPSYLALLFTVGFFIWILFTTIFSKYKDDVITMGLISAITIVLTYYFGSSNDKKNS